MSNQPDQSEQIKLTDKAAEMVKSAAPSAEEATRLKVELKAKMIDTMAAMREATKNVGSFGAQIGRDDMGAFIFKEPLVDKKPSFQGAQTDSDYHTYVVATQEGFVGVEIQHDDKYPLQLEAEKQLINALNRAQDGVVSTTSTQEPGYFHRQEFNRQFLVPAPSHKAGDPDMIYWHNGAGDKVVDVTPDQVTKAIQSSIAKAQAPHKAASAQAMTQIGNTANVGAHLSAAANK